MTKDKGGLWRAYAGLALRLAALGAIGWVLFSQVFLITQVRGTDMFPAVKDGDLVLAYRLQKSYAKNDVVIYDAAGKSRIGRIAANAGDAVQLDDSGILLVNGTDQTGEILYPTDPKQTLRYPYAVPEGQLFLLGDYRTQAEDSRDFGAVPLGQIRGKVITILRRRGL